MNTMERALVRPSSIRAKHFSFRSIKRPFGNLAKSRALHDYLAGLDGLLAMVSQGRVQDQIDIALSLFSADSPAIREGCISTYRTTLFNSGPTPRWLKLIVDIYLKENAVHPNGHFGYFDKAIMVGPRDSQDVQIAFDWKERAVFRIEGVNFPADGLWWGPCRTAGVYSVRAIAAETQGQTLAQLEIHQKLSR